MTEAIQASTLENESSVSSTGRLFETRQELRDAEYTAGPAMWQKTPCFSQTRREVTLNSRFSRPGCI